MIHGYRADVRLPETAAAHRARVGIVIRTPVAGYARRLGALPGFGDIETVTGEYDLIVSATAATATERDGLDGVSVGEAVAAARPDVIVHR